MGPGAEFVGDVRILLKLLDLKSPFESLIPVFRVDDYLSFT